MKHMTFNEAELLPKAQDLDLEALEEIYDHLSPSLFRYAYRLLGNTHLAEDCVSETFNRFLTKLSERKGPKQYLKAYLYRIAHNWITDFYRRKHFEEVEIPDNLVSSMKSPESQTLENLESKQVREAILQLPPNQQQVILLRFLEGWSIQEIAKSINKSTGAVKLIQNRGFKKLRSLLEEEDDEDEKYEKRVKIYSTADK